MSPIPSFVKRIVGCRLAHSQVSPTERALLAADLIRGTAALARPTRRQAMALTGANGSYLNFALKLTDRERRNVELGLVPLATAHAPPAPRQPSSKDNLFASLRAVG
jgi:hypothetical protein